jgi:1-acyl-sn-glycerol-3-phosphate acyltransferase
MNATVVTTIVLSLILWVLLWPLAAIWALNTLFGLGIAYTFWNWLAMVVLVAFFGKNTVTNSKD